MRRLSTLRIALLTGFTVAVLGAAGLALSQMLALPAHPSSAVTPQGLLSQHFDDSAPNAAQVRLGQYLVAAGDCISCHLRADGEPFAGGLGLNTPFGVIYTSNISSDPHQGIGNWMPDQFYRAMHDGIGGHDQHLYPAFPYPWFRNLSHQDDDAVLAYLKTTPPVNYQPPDNKLVFP